MSKKNRARRPPQPRPTTTLALLRDAPSWDWPADAGQLLLEILRREETPDAELALAAELAGDLTVMDDAIAAALLDLVRRPDRSDQVRGQAAIGLGPALEECDTGDDCCLDCVPLTDGRFDEVRETLRALYAATDGPTEVRRRILEASVRSPQAWHRAAIEAAYASADDGWRLTAVFCMRFVRGFDAQILEALGSPHPAVHREAVEAAGSWALAEAWAHITTLLQSPDTEKQLLLAAIEAAAEIRPAEAAALLGDFLDSDDEDLVAAAEEAIEMVDDPFADGGEPADEDIPF